MKKEEVVQQVVCWNQKDVLTAEITLAIRYMLLKKEEKKYGFSTKKAQEIFQKILRISKETPWVPINILLDENDLEKKRFFLTFCSMRDNTEIPSIIITINGEPTLPIGMRFSKKKKKIEYTILSPVASDYEEFEIEFSSSKEEGTLSVNIVLHK